MIDMKPEAKGPLQSKTLGLGLLTLIAGIVGKSNPAVGDFLRGNAETILTVLGGLAVVLRGTTSKPLDAKDWTLFGVGKKF